MSEELFKKKDVVGKEKVKRHITDKAWVAIHRAQVMKYFCTKWQAKYGIVYIIPPKSWVSVDMPIQQAIESGYTIDMLQKGIDSYLSNEFAGYIEQSHPIKFFTGNITKWVLQAGRETKQKQDAPVTDEIRLLNEKYGILKRGESWLTEDGRVFNSAKDAIRHTESKGAV
jgi:hypothetical protein